MSVQMTVAIASYQRREALLRLLHGLAAELQESPQLREAVQVVAVLDGSTDGSKEAVASLDFPVPLETVWQPNRGLAAARNAALRAARGRLIWFLDDDLLPSEGLTARHLAEHAQGEPHLLLGPCLPSPDSSAGTGWLEWWAKQFEALAAAGVVDRFDRFTVANMSGPADIFRSAGWFDESFTSYGMEDYELGYRVLNAGTTVRFDPGAVAWHMHAEGEKMEILRARTIAHNTVAIARRHPETIPALFPGGGTNFYNRVLAATCLRSPRSLRLLAWLATRVGFDLRPLPRRVRTISRHLAHAASYASGIAETAPELLPAVLAGKEGHLLAPADP